ncbi:MAG: UDP-N-acetylmuramate dehydrogenase, partial [Cyclobacteriaceae bacterium]
MNIAENVSLKPYNTFGIDVKARYMVTITDEDQIRQLIDSDIYKNNQSLILGGGSNVLLTGDYEGLVIKNNIAGKEILEDTNQYVLVKFGAGENWHETVLFAVEKGWNGIENMSLIPGTVGAAPMQNIGAYGVEIKEVFHSLEAIDLQTGEKQTFDKEQCGFGYRQSIFKTSHKNRFFITSVSLTFPKSATINTSYGAIRQILDDMKVHQPTIRDVSEAVIRIRQSKLPDPSKIGNAGSFFKNPVVPMSQFVQLKEQFPDIVGYQTDLGVKVPAGWLIENAGWKGKTFDKVGVHKDQALVLVN